MSGAGDCLLADSGRVPRWLAQCGGEGGEEAGGSVGQAHGAGGGGSDLPPVGKAGSAAPEGQCGHIGQQSAIPACCQY